jgi:mxaJ protein
MPSKSTNPRRRLLCFWLAITAGFATHASAAGGRQLRVCADGNNMPFSNQRGEGFENKLAQLIANDLGAELSYVWAPQRRGFIRNTLNANRCDVVMGVPAKLGIVATSRPYYRSGYVFVYGPRSPHVNSLDAPELHRLRIGVPLVGDDGANPPPALALALRGLVPNIRGYSVYGDYRADTPPAELVRALRRGEIDIALAWGPLAGYYAAHPEPALAFALIPESEAPPGLTFGFDISLGVRRADEPLLAELDGILLKRQRAIEKLLDRYGVPRL